MINIVPTLKVFLEEENKLFEFVKNADSRKYFTKDHYFYSIQGSFNWKKSPEGVVFWQKLHKEYEEKYGHLNEHQPWRHMATMN